LQQEKKKDHGAEEVWGEYQSTRKKVLELTRSGKAQKLSIVWKNPTGVAEEGGERRRSTILRDNEEKPREERGAAGTHNGTSSIWQAEGKRTGEGERPPTLPYPSSLAEQGNRGEGKGGVRNVGKMGNP